MLLLYSYSSKPSRSEKMISTVQLAVLLLSAVVINFSFAQFPMACSDNDSLTNGICCPDAEDGSGMCGGDERGSCQNISIPTSSNARHKQVRDRWPFYFRQVCNCVGNFAGYDCTRCKYGYYGDQCDMKYSGIRKSISQFTSSEWNEYTDILNNTRTYNSSYFVFTEEPTTDTTSFTTLNKAENVSLYKLFVWQHHYVAKDNEKGNINLLYYACMYL